MEYPNPQNEKPMKDKDLRKYFLIGIIILIVVCLAAIGLGYLLGNYPPLTK